MKQIQLTKNKITLVDDDVYEWAKNYKWFALKCDKLFYAGRRFRDENNKQRTVLLHHTILGYPLSKQKIDHIDGDGLNNQRFNLRIVSNRQNLQNTKIHRTGRLVGTYLMKGNFRNKPWRAQIQIKGKIKYLGYFKTEQEAYQQYLRGLNDN